MKNSMPFKSKAQMKAAFSGALGPEMKSKAKIWAKETPNIGKLPARLRAKKKINLKKTHLHFQAAVGKLSRAMKGTK